MLLIIRNDSNCDMLLQCTLLLHCVKVCEVTIAWSNKLPFYYLYLRFAIFWFWSTEFARHPSSSQTCLFKVKVDVSSCASRSFICIDIWRYNTFIVSCRVFPTPRFARRKATTCIATRACQSSHATPTSSTFLPPTRRTSARCAGTPCLSSRRISVAARCWERSRRCSVTLRQFTSGRRPCTRPHQWEIRQRNSERANLRRYNHKSELRLSMRNQNCDRSEQKWASGSRRGKTTTVDSRKLAMLLITLSTKNARRRSRGVSCGSAESMSRVRHWATSRWTLLRWGLQDTIVTRSVNAMHDVSASKTDQKGNSTEKTECVRRHRRHLWLRKKYYFLLQHNVSE